VAFTFIFESLCSLQQSFVFIDLAFVELAFDSLEEGTASELNDAPVNVNSITTQIVWISESQNLRISESQIITVGGSFISRHVCFPNVLNRSIKPNQPSD